ncbi:MAG: cellulose synthase/poly-beta-1,6-N-acetylglucosamine synthase-like glycosyltransferase [Pseudohongiellaceae bacterium]|jgi:cellulose synthase/poly-beta-1,6-N-acetylglucosamine synthase-like glycosyltransferase
MLAFLLLIPCVVWIASAALALRSITAIPQLTELHPSAPQHWPRVSVIVPACNEAATLPEAAAKLTALDYPNLELIFVDDRSTDGTTAIVDDLAARDERTVAVHVTELPTDWLGKPHAMERGLEAATGEWVLFTDADVHFAPQTLRDAIAWSVAEEVDHLTVLPDLDADGFALQATLASFGRYFTLGQHLWKVNDDNSSASVGVGAFNLVRRSALQQTAGLPWLALETVDDLALGQLMKASGAKSRVLWGQDALAVHWYPTLSEMTVGLEKNTFPAVGCSLWRLAAMALVILFLDWTPVGILLFPSLPLWLRAASLITIVVCLLSGAWIARWARRPLAPALAVPLGSAIMAFILLRSGIVGAARGGVRWRGTFYPSELLRRGSRVKLF